MVQGENWNLSLYEKLCSFFEKFPIFIPKDLEKRYEDEIKYCDLMVTPRGVFALSFYLFLFILLTSLIVLFIVPSLFLPLLLISIIVFYYFLNYTRFLSIYRRVQASAEMVLCVVYMAIGLKISRNLEVAISLAAENLRGSIGKDLRNILAKIQKGEIISAEKGIEILSDKWKVESEEFYDALSLLRTSLSSPNPDKDINEAVRIILEGTEKRMKTFSFSVKTPVRIISAFGILFPTIVFTFIPITIVFLPEVGRPEIIFTFYNVVIPFVILILTKKFYYTRPYSLHYIEAEKIESYSKSKKFLRVTLIILVLPLLLYLFYELFKIKGLYSSSALLVSYAIISLIFISSFVYYFIPTFFSRKKRDELAYIEEELSTLLYELGIVLELGKPIEEVLEQAYYRIKNLRISAFLRKIILNIKSRGYSFEKSVFHEEHGAIKEFPSKALHSILKLIVSISKKGSLFLSESLKYMSSFLEDVKRVNLSFEEILAGAVSDLKLQAYVFAPVAMGVVAGLMLLIFNVFSFLVERLGELMPGEMGSSAVGGILTPFLGFKETLPFHFFHIACGLYLFQLLFLLSDFLSSILYGDDTIRRDMEKAKILLIGFVIYSIILLFLYLLSLIINIGSLLVGG